MVKTMLRKDFAEKVLRFGESKGLKDMEIFYDSSRELSIKSYQGKIDNFSVSNSEGVSFRALHNNKMGYAYTEKVDDSSIPFLVEEAMQNAAIIDSDDNENIYIGVDEYKKIDNYNLDLDQVTEEQKIQLALDLENEASCLDERIQSIQYCVYGDVAGETNIVNSKGLSLSSKSNIAFAYVGVVAKNGDDIKTGMAYKATNDFLKINPKEIAREAVEEAISMLGAESVQSGNYPIILRNNAACDLLESFSDVFSAENVQKDLSLLKAKIGQTIACSDLNIIDNPHMKDGFASNPFDGEGYPTQIKKVVENGILKTYLHNLKTSEKDGVSSTGNASRSSYKSTIGISPSNFFIENGTYTMEDMVKSIDKGLLLIELQGLHSGLNSVSGDFSLSCYGYLIEKGKISKPVNQITVSGNFFKMIKNIEMIGNDLKFGLPAGSYFGAPSLKINELSIAGK
ncbi:MAG: TldD/PmbA family protein [Eubacteriales bacterium]|nr:TldD/PmbA family protein [Eubacteriales bacterium]